MQAFGFFPVPCLPWDFQVCLGFAYKSLLFAEYNFDHPDALDNGAVIECLQNLKVSPGLFMHLHTLWLNNV